MAKNLEKKLKRRFEAIQDRKVSEREEWEFGKKIAYSDSVKSKAISAANEIVLLESRRPRKTEEAKKLMKASGGKPVVVLGGKGPYALDTPEEAIRKMKLVCKTLREGKQYPPYLEVFEDD